ncbi:DUF1361 domain-containing protein [Flavobacterium sp. RHBU_24]|uniref:DUF1361 domain-containing protein n=1 Tax=Flavobacterium sp. RHBU_24 TaxID=3391185 RepID=UPI0039855BC4
MNTTIKLKMSKPVRDNAVALALSAFSISLLLVRVTITHSIFYLFLAWNLFLAYTPLAMSILIISSQRILSRWYWLAPALTVWLLLLPNAPYLITDFVHLKKETPVPVWYDVLLLASFTFSGLLIGLASMKNIYILLSAKFNRKMAGSAMLAICFLSGFGLYLGRFLRYNSWDVLHRPLSLAGDIWLSLFAAETCKPAWGITIGFGILQYLLFDLYKSVKR